MRCVFFELHYVHPTIAADWRHSAFFLRDRQCGGTRGHVAAAAAETAAAAGSADVAVAVLATDIVGAAKSSGARVYSGASVASAESRSVPALMPWDANLFYVCAFVVSGPAAIV